MYKGFIKKAKKDDYYLAEFSFNLARKAEIVHSKLFIKYLKRLDNEENFERRTLFVCRICGNVELDKPPSTCPNCEHHKKFFKEIER
jgi:rubrerythrin